jgi:hypothetical protein
VALLDEDPRRSRCVRPRADDCAARCDELRHELRRQGPTHPDNNKIDSLVPRSRSQAAAFGLFASVSQIESQTTGMDGKASTAARSSRPSTPDAPQ